MYGVCYRGSQSKMFYQSGGDITNLSQLKHVETLSETQMRNNIRRHKRPPLQHIRPLVRARSISAYSLHSQGDLPPDFRVPVDP